MAQREGWIDKLREVFQRRNPVLVLGSTGVGKTQLLTSLKSVIPEAISMLSRTTVVEKSKLHIGKTPFEFVDTPGQRISDMQRSVASREALKSKVRPIVFHVVSYGYHEYATERAAEAIRGNQVDPDFLAIHRAREIESLREMAPLMLDQASSRALFTIATKADLWWENRDAVTTHYEGGEYGSVVRQTSNVPHSVLKYCSVVHPFYDRAAGANSFGDVERMSLRAHLLHQLLVAAAGAK